MNFAVVLISTRVYIMSIYIICQQQKVVYIVQYYNTTFL